jgi:hypothetical protein
MGKCEGDDCYYRDNSSYTIESITRCVVNAYDDHFYAHRGNPTLVDLCDMCIRKHDPCKCAMCRRKMVDDSITIATEPICAFCIGNLPFESSPNPEKLKEFIAAVPVDWDARTDCECELLEICETEIEGLQKWISGVIQCNKEKGEKRKKRFEELRKLAEAHLVRRGYTEWESFKLVRRFGRKVRYMEHLKIANLLLEKTRF